MTAPPKSFQAEISLYPLRRPTLTEQIAPFIDQLREAGLEVEYGRLSTLVKGPPAELFAAIGRAMQAAAESGDVVLVVKATNALPGA
jgi:uncharacterized protein YqgV (UPF0045/DUF77 family)